MAQIRVPSSSIVEALLRLDEDEKAEHEQYSGSDRKPTLVNEPGLYSLILRSREPEARSFTRIR